MLRESLMVDMQSFRVIRTASWVLGDAVIAKKYYAPAMPPRSEMCDTGAIDQSKQKLLHRGKLSPESDEQVCDAES